MVMRVFLTKDMSALVDDEDYASVVGPDPNRPFRWHATQSKGKWYAARSLPWQREPYRRSRPKLYLHRFIVGCSDSKVMVDHYDSDGLNCMRTNLMVCSHLWNNHNRVTDIGPGGFRGVDLHHDRWRARIGIHNTEIYLGTFDTPEEAALAYDAKAVELHGPLARTNLREGRFKSELVPELKPQPVSQALPEFADVPF